MKSTYDLKIYDTKLVEFSLDDEGIEGLRAEILYINHDAQFLFPLDLTIDEEGIIKWLQNRVIPKNRAFADEILKLYGLSFNNTKGIIDISKGLSLNDSYWVIPCDFTGSFSEYNLFENRYSEILSLVAFTGAGGTKEAFTTSPEFTTNGMLRKAWHYIENDGIYLYKGGTEGASNTGNEPFSEYYASQIGEKMGLHIVHYDLEMWKGILSSKCRLFTDINTSYIPIGRIVKSGGIKAILEYYQTLVPDAYEELKSMLVFDALIYNEDRHFGNFGLLRDNHTGKLKAPAPIFDNGYSLFNYGTPSDFNQLNEYAKTRSTPYGVSFETICKEVIGPLQRKQLRKMIGFQFTRHPIYNLPEYRLQAIEEQLQRRIKQLLEL